MLSRADALLEIDGAVNMAYTQVKQRVTAVITQRQVVDRNEIAVTFLDEPMLDLAENVDDVLHAFFDDHPPDEDDFEEMAMQNDSIVAVHFALENAEQALWEAIDGFLQAERPPSEARISARLRRIFRGMREEVAQVIDGLPSSTSEDEGGGVILPLVRRRRRG